MAAEARVKRLGESIRMLLCDAIELEPWRPDFSSSGQSNPLWTRISCGGLRIANAVEWIDWEKNPVQVVLCEACGHPGCSPGNDVHLSRLGDLILWSSPQVDDAEDWAVDQYMPSQALRMHGALAFPAWQWERLCAVDGDVPPPTTIGRATRRVLADAWRFSARGSAQVDTLGAVLPMLRERALATDRFESAEAIRVLTPLLDWLGADSAEPLAGSIQSAASVSAQVETFYFDGPRDQGWPAFAILGSSPLLALSRELVFVPD